MSDPRYVEPRCPEVMNNGDVMHRLFYRCQFRNGHEGLHSGVIDDRPEFEPMRWGNEAMLAAEPLDKLLPPLDQRLIDWHVNSELEEARHYLVKQGYNTPAAIIRDREWRKK